MSSQLLDILVRSEKRKNILLMLQEGPRETTSLLDSLKTTRQSLLPQIKILEDSHLVSHYEDIYELTRVGKLLVDEMTPLLDTLDVIDIDIDFWGRHNLDFCPSHLLNRFDEMKGCCIVKPSLVNMYEINKDFIELSKTSRSLYLIFTFTHPEFPPLISEFIESGKDAWIIITRGLYQKLKEEHPERVQRFIDSGKVRYYVYPKAIELSSFTLNDSCMILRLLTDDGFYDYKQVKCCNPVSLQWGKELFEYYLKDSVLITEI